MELKCNLDEQQCQQECQHKENRVDCPNVTVTEADEQTGVNPDKPIGPGNPPRSGTFSNTKQPAGALKSAGWKKKKFTRDTIREMLNFPFDINKHPKKAELIAIFGEDAFNGITNGQMMSMVQLRKGIEDGNPMSYQLLVDHSIGRPVQAIAPTNAAGDDLPPITLKVPVGINLNMPSNTEGDDKQTIHEPKD